MLVSDGPDQEDDGFSKATTRCCFEAAVARAINGLPERGSPLSLVFDQDKPPHGPRVRTITFSHYNSYVPALSGGRAHIRVT